LGVVVILSTIKRDLVWSPLLSVGSTVMRKSGASVGSLVKAQMVTELVPLKRTSCTMTTGRGLP
jgi:hypothetical protein